jgi:hypothetical protein
MRRCLISGLAAFLLMLATPGLAQQTFGITPSNTSTQTMSVTTSSSSITLDSRTGSTVIIANTGASTAFITSTSTATTTGFPIPAGYAMAFNFPPGSTISAITASSTTTLIVGKGSGATSLAGGGTAGAVGETVTQGGPGTNASSWWVQIGDGVNGPVDVTAPLLDGLAPGALLGTWNQNYLYNGSTLSIQRDMPGAALATGFGVASVHTRPNSSANSANTPSVTTAAAAAHVLKAGAGNLYSVYATNLTATAGFLVVIDAVASPADGAITPLDCAPLPANGNASINYSGAPSRYSVGITAVVTSAATCFTKTTGVISAFINGAVQ